MEMGQWVELVMGLGAMSDREDEEHGVFVNAKKRYDTRATT